MHITDLLLKYRTPLFEAAGAGGPGAAPDAGGAPAPAEGAAPTALGGAAPADGDKAPDAGADGAAEGEKPADGADGGDADGDGEKPDGDKEGDGENAEPGEFKISAPEGMEEFQGDVDTFSSEASKWMQDNPKATPAEALQWAASRQMQAVATQTQSATEAFTAQIDTWDAELAAHPVIGGENFDANKAQALRAVEAFGGADNGAALKNLLNETGLGSQPALVEWAFNAGKGLKAADVIKTNEGTAKKSMAESLYGKD